MRIRKILLALVLLLAATTTFFAQNAVPRANQAANQTSRLRGRVLDSTGAVMPGASVRIFQGENLVREGTTSETGDFDLEAVPGEYRLEVSAEDFNTYREAVRVAPNMGPLSVSMTLAVVSTTVDVTEDVEDVQLSLDSSLGTTTLSGAQLEDLPDNEDELAAYLQQLAGATGNAESTANFVIDGFNGGRLPPRDQIQQVIVENNPFSAEGGGDGPRIRIVTRPGTGDWRGGAGFNFRDESLNAKSASATNKPASQRRNFNMNFSGPIIPGRMSLNFQGSKQESESEGNSIQARTPFGSVASGVVSPTASMSLNPRFQFFINQRNTLNFSFNYSKSESENQGIGGFNLPERASNSNRNQFSFQISENAQIGSWNNELRFQMNRNDSDQTPVTQAVSINVLDAFNGGGNSNLSSDETRSYQIANQLRTSRAEGKWQINTGVELNYDQTNSISQSNYLGTYTFSSLQDYCKATNFEGINCQETRAIVETAAAEGIAPTYLNSLGEVVTITGVPTQFTRTSGDPQLRVSQMQFNAFFENTLRLTQKFNAQIGVRYQAQNHLSDYNNIGPRVNFRYQLFPNTIISAGSGLIYNQTGFSMNNYEQLLRNDGTSRQFQTVITTFDPADPFNVSGGTTRGATTQIRTRSSDFVAPYNVQSRVSLEQRLPKQIGLTVTFGTSRGVHLLRTLNTNAPLPGTLVRPDPTRGNILQYESIGKSFSKNLSFFYRQNLRSGLWNVNMNANYTLGWSKDDGAGGGGGFGGFGGGGNNFGGGGNNFGGGNFGGGGLPSNNYDLAADWGRSQNDQRHRFQANININMPWNISFRLNPSASSGRPYNITTGRDDNGDTTINDRPQGLARNSGNGPSNYNINLNFSKTFALRPQQSSQPAASAANSFVEPQRGGGGFPGGGGQGGRPQGQGDRNQGGPGGQRPGQITGPRMTFNIQVSNLFNRPNQQVQSGVLTSPYFGLITGNQPRTVSLSVNFQELF
jgi:hypothetical protein